MRVVTCLWQDHNWNMALLAAAMCVAGSRVAVRLLARTFGERGVARWHWAFLAAVCAGASTWATHFIAMLGYDPGVSISFDGTLTIVSALIAVAGIGTGIAVAAAAGPAIAVIVGGGGIGLAVAAMHYTGMFAYRADGIVRWLPGYVIASMVLSIGLGGAAVFAVRRRPDRTGEVRATALLVAAVCALHFTGMAAFVVEPLPGIRPNGDSDSFTALAAAIALVALLLVGTGVSSHLLDRRTRADSADRLEHAAMHDPLTGLGNRRLFNAELERHCAALSGAGAPFALLMIDLDRFKPVNDLFGHPVGDAVLAKVAGRLRHAMRAHDTICRIGGDEFAILAPGNADAATVEDLAARIVEILGRPFLVDGRVAEIGGSVGIVLAPRHGDDAETLVQDADIALYTAKREGRDRHCMFEPKFTAASQRRHGLEASLRRASARGDFRVVYQPLTDTATGRYTGAEALIRWTCPDYGEVSPTEFVPMAEELGLIARIGASVLRQACVDAAAWPRPIYVAVNISPVQLMDPRLPATVRAALAASGLPPDRLELEITETALLGNDDVGLDTLNALRAIGVWITLDDFGTGYSSLSYLHRFPISRIKIDRSFVLRLPDDQSSASIVRAMAQLGASLGLAVTAEGIETEAQLAAVTGFGCDNAQGFLLGRPVDTGAIARLLRDQADSAAA